MRQVSERFLCWILLWPLGLDDMGKVEKNFVVQGRGIVKDFPAGDEMIRVLHGIDISLSYGELVMLVGPSGSGKTTLLSIITGILTPTSGDVFINGEELTNISDLEKVQHRLKNIGFIFQQFNLIPALTAVENAAVPLIAANVPYGEALKASKDVLTKIGMGDQLDKIPVHLSGGQQQRVSIARALVHDPKFIVCDEPTSSLDAHTGHVVMEILKSIVSRANRSVLVVTHDSRIFEFADRILFMDDGRIVKEEKRVKK